MDLQIVISEVEDETFKASDNMCDACMSGLVDLGDTFQLKITHEEETEFQYVHTNCVCPHVRRLYKEHRAGTFP